MRTLIVTASDEQFAPLMRGLVESLHQWEEVPFTDLAFFDLGLGGENREWIERYAKHIVEPGWDFPVHEEMRTTKPSWRALTVRPLLPTYFPGYDVYLWIDSDAWVQERTAIETYIESAERYQFAAATHSDPSYITSSHVRDFRSERMQSFYGREVAKKAVWGKYFNTGAFALRVDAPHWELWAKWLRRGLEAVEGKDCSDQVALNVSIWQENLVSFALPALCNWLCHLALPGINFKERRLCEPDGKRRNLGILHLTGPWKERRVQLRVGEVRREISLRFPGIGKAVI